jgi:hypothetical protein
MSSMPLNPSSLNARLTTWQHDANSSSPPTSAAASPYVKITPDPTTASAKPSSRNLDFFPLSHWQSRQKTALSGIKIRTWRADMVLYFARVLRLSPTMKVATKGASFRP